MSVLKKWKVEICERKEIKDFIETYHYSHSINGLCSSYCFKLLDTDGVIKGAMIYGTFGMASVWEKYADSKDKVIELRRLCCVDDTPKNTESYFIGKTIKWLRDNTAIERIISYADNEYGHTGTIYQASNFKKIGETAPSRVIIYQGKRYHDKTIRTKYKGKLKPFAQKVKDALENGEAYYKKQRLKISILTI